MNGVKKNIFFQTIYEILLIIMPLLTSPYIARVLGAEKIGIYTLSYAIAYYFQIIASLGIKYHGTRTIASVKDNQDKLNKEFSSIFVFHTIFSICILIIYIFYLLFFVKENMIISLIQILNIIGIVFDISWFYFGIEKFKITTVLNSIIKIVTVALIFIFVKRPDDLWIYTLIMSLGIFLSYFTPWIFIKNRVKFIKPKLKEVLFHLKPMITLFIPIFAISLFGYMDKIMLGFSVSKIQTGLYENADKAISIPMTIIYAFSTVMLPRITALIDSGNKEKSKYYTRVSFKYMELLGIGMSFGLFCISDIFAVVFWGSEFKDCGILIKILAMSIPFKTYSCIIRTQYLIPKKKDKIYISSVLSGGLLNLILNLLLIQPLMSMGAAIATVTSEIFVMIYQSIAIKKEFPQKEYIKSFLFFFIPAVLMVIIIMVINNYMSKDLLSLIIELFVGFILYGGISVLYLYKTEDEVFANTILNLKKLKKT